MIKLLNCFFIAKNICRFRMSQLAYKNIPLKVADSGIPNLSLNGRTKPNLPVFPSCCHFNLQIPVFIPHLLSKLYNVIQ